jgi:diaminopimelate decarboxylase
VSATQWFPTIDGRVHAERVPLEEIARAHGTPTFVYSRGAIESAWREFEQGTAGRDALVCYAIKANSNLGVLGLLAQMGAGFDIVSAGELRRVAAAGGDPARVVFSGVGKTAAEMRLALDAGVRCFNVESEPELERLDRVARDSGRIAPVSLRVNPDIDAGTHPYISTGLRDNKFGIAHHRALDAYRMAARLPNLRITGIDCHIGSQITELAPFLAALERLLDLVDQLAAAGIMIQHMDLGGGLGIAYRDETPPSRTAMLDALFTRIERWAKSRSRPMPMVMFEFGRAMVGNAGVLLTRTEYLKHTDDRNFAIVDAAMNDLMRPTLYDAYHAIVPVAPRDGEARDYDVVGPICESGDWLGRDRRLALREGDLLAILSAGAYGMSMSSNYNARPRAAEVMVDGDAVHVVRARETVESLYAGERLLPKR